MTSNVQDRNRVRAGVREGGQFATEAKAETDVTLTAPAVEEEQVVEAYSPVYVIPENAVEEATRRVEKANRRLERAGIEQRFEMTWGEPYVRKVTVEGGTRVDRWYRDLELSAPVLSYGGWEFVAALDQAGPDDGDLVARTRPGADLSGWRPESMRCDHCGKYRSRSATYVVRHEDGTVKQVGSSCMQNFLGIRPSGLWTLDMDPLEDIDDWAPSTWAADVGDAATATDVIRAAIAATEGGKRYVSTNAAQYGVGTATSDTVRKALGLFPVMEHERDDIADVAARIRDVSDGDVQEVLAFARVIEGDSDYATNLRTLAAQEWTGTRHVGILASAVAVWAREKGRQVERERKVASYVPGHMAPVGEKLKGRSVTVTKVSYIDDPYSYYGGVNTLVIMRDEDGHEVKWFASGRKELDTGDRLALTGGSVKKHDVYDGRDQTVITRVKYEVVATEDDATDAAA